MSEVRRNSGLLRTPQGSPSCFSSLSCHDGLSNREGLSKLSQSALSYSFGMSFLSSF